MPFSDRARAAWRWLGLEGVVLLAALLCDVLIMLPAAFDDIGPRGRDLLLLPGIVAIAGCALWGRAHPARGAFGGAAALVGSTVLIRATETPPFSTLLTDISLTETIAGVELVYLAVRWLRPGLAFAAVTNLVIAGLFASTLRGDTRFGSDRTLLTLLMGATLLVAAVVAGMRLRRESAPKHTNALTRLVRDQWPLIGVLTLPLFLELTQALQRGPRDYLMLLCSIASAALAVYGTVRPVVAGVLTSGVFLLSGFFGWVAPVRYNLPFQAMPLTEIVAGIVLVVLLVRTARPAQAWTVIGVMSVAVALTTAANVYSRTGFYSLGLRSFALAALLVLGISVAIGLYFRARDSERAKVVEAAVTEAQTSERMALARELHDVVAHHVTGIVVQAQAAKLIGGKNPALALDALQRIEEAGTEALVAMRRLVRSMRSDDGQTEQATTDLEADLRRLADTAHHGVRTDLKLALTPDIPQEVARSALRLVQESLTNVGKHAAGATRVVVLAEVHDRELHIRVTDDGRMEHVRPAGGGVETATRSVSVEGGGGWREGGYGLVGMRERVELLHGRLLAGPVEGGWAVEAWLPLEGEAE
ncbi:MULTISPECIES: sensor histidine kinase [Amycolatopsis]|uniref:histidine kinase n=2 Tax=Amycolatopsis TaxID=1813 RepID=A0A1I3S3N6_9PSEU|nr:histidine kinase [Amycolatopsis sacchari]SFJ52672.1 Signal transduction histidine kinase [Amycolatopsis sacchari]